MRWAPTDLAESIVLARTRLNQLLDQTTSEALSSPSSTILSVPSPAGLEPFFAANHKSASSRYQAYLARRKLGSPREIFPTRDFAVEWLKLAACVKYVDGSWIANSVGAGLRSLGSNGNADIHSSRTERDPAKLAWQVISEEFGDGDLQKNHVHVYHQLVQSLSAGAPSGDVAGFDGLAEDGGSPRCWSAAVAQQCVGLLAGAAEGDSFPEALGFNMAYETLPFHLLVTSYELRELRIDDYYFALHITIDNPDSGHGAMARLAVEQYLVGVEKRDGKETAERMWRRVQAGVLLAEGLPTTPSGPVEFGWDQGGHRWRPIPAVSPAPAPRPASSVEHNMVELLHRKAKASEHMHCPSRLQFAGQTLEQWLDPLAWTSERGLAFLRALADKRPWVVKGDDAKSRLVRELQWGGRMFGAFSDMEVKATRSWIVGLGEDSELSTVGAYQRYIGEAVTLTSNTSSAQLTVRTGDALHSTAPSRFSQAASTLLPHPTAETLDFVLSRLTSASSLPPVSSLPSHLQAALLLISLSLLDLFPLHPAKFASPVGCTVLRIIRAQLGFPALHRTEDICSGTDEVDLKGLWEVAEEHFRSARFTLPGSLVELAAVVEADQSAEAREVAELCADLLVLRLHPYKQAPLLLGFTAGMTGMWDAVVGQVAIVKRIRGDIEAAIMQYEAEQLSEGDRALFEAGKAKFLG